MQDTVNEAVVACQAGDPDVMRRIYDSSHRNVYRLMVRMVGEQDAADVAQQVFLQVFRKIAQFSGRSQLGTWIYRLAVNEALQHLRKRQRHRAGTLEQEPMDRTPDNRRTGDNKELLERALSRLDPELRTAFLLREVEGLSYSEIAEAMDIPEGTVGSRLNRARRELRDHLTALGWDS